MYITNIEKTITTTLGKESESKATYNVSANGTTEELECFAYNLPIFADNMCVECECSEEEAYDTKRPLFGGAFHNEFGELIYIEKVIYNKDKRTTAVLWNDGVKTTAKCQPEDVYSKETGLLIATMKRVVGSDFINNLISDWSTMEDDDVVIRTLASVRKMRNEIKKLSK